MLYNSWMNSIGYVIGVIKTAIEHYSTVDIKKSEHFQRKLTALLTNPNTIDVIEHKQEKLISVKTAHLDQEGYEKNLKHELYKFNSQSNIMVKSILEGSEKKVEHQNRILHQNLTTQESRLQRRLEERSKSKSRTRI